jgi:RND superfamily putative drug exporter
VTARIGMFSFRHRWLVLSAWLVILVGGAASAGPVLASLESDNDGYAPESVQAYDVLDQGSDLGGRVVGLIEDVDPAAAATQDALTRAAAEIRTFADVATVDDPVPAVDGAGVALPVTLARLTDTAAEQAAAERVADRLRAIAADLPGSTVRVGGGAVLQHEVNDVVARDLNTAELRGLPLTLVVLIFVFGGLVAAGVPLLATIVTLFGGFGVLLGFSQFIQLDTNVVTVVTLLSLGLSIDYGLLLVARYREELVPGYRAAQAAGQQVDRATRAQALARAWGTAGRTIMFSGLIVAAALCGLLTIQIRDLQAMAAGGIAAALVAVAAALTFTAALVSVFGRRIRPSRRTLRPALTAPVPGTARTGSAGGAGREDETGFFAAVARFTQRWPVPVALVTVAGLLAAGYPLVRMKVELTGLEGLPTSIESVAVANDLSARYGESSQPAVLVVARTTADSLATWSSRWAADPAVLRVEPVVAAGPDLSLVRFAVRGDDQDGAARALVERVRADRPPGVESWVSGQAGLLVDVLATLRDSLPWAAAVTVLAMFVLLFLMTGSVVVPLKAILMGVLSLGASFGVLVVLFQDGWLADQLGTLTTGGLNPFVMSVVFAFAFGLSMDYEVFLLGRIKEYVDAGHDTDTAVRRGLQHTGRIITTAALLMIIVFGAFGFAEISDIEQIGVGLAVAVLVDATVVRILLVPATMTLLGRWNWWAPAPLRRLHQRLHGRSGHAAPAVSEAVGLAFADERDGRR